MRYQWGRKDPFVFAISSEYNGDHYGKYPVKIYTIDGVLIYQESNGSSNTDKQPVGGIIFSSIEATSVMETINSPITYYNKPVISQSGHTKDLFDYYWASYSRGTDGNSYPGNNSNWHNDYLDGYISQHLKSIYDPCPYGFRVPSNGVYNDNSLQMTWITNSYIGGGVWKMQGIVNWMSGLGIIVQSLSSFRDVGVRGFFSMSIPSERSTLYSLRIGYDNNQWENRIDMPRATGYSVRCIDFSSIRPDRRTRPVWNCAKYRLLYQ